MKSAQIVNLMAVIPFFIISLNIQTSRPRQIVCYDTATCFEPVTGHHRAVT
jgi:hypothetical protein